METKKEYLKNAGKDYDRKVKANKIALKLSKKLENLRSKGYKIMILGNVVKIT
jgi:hypothetical protein